MYIECDEKKIGTGSMRYPKFLKDNERIGLIAPSFGCASEPYATRIDAAIKKLNNLGYEIVEGPNSRLSLGIGKSNTPVNCAKEVNDFFLNDYSDVIISCGGGELMCEDLEYIDFLSIARANPKWFMGYSDNTNLTFLLPLLCDIAAIYGPCIGTFGMDKWHDSINDAYMLLRGEKTVFNNYDGFETPSDDEVSPTAEYSIDMPYKQDILNAPDGEASFTGRMMGGCMDILELFIGTEYDKVKEFNYKYKEDGLIWFLECCDYNVFDMRRCLWHMEKAGWFENVKGFIIGRPLHLDDEFDGFTPNDAFGDFLKKYNVPVIMNVDIGHVSPMMPVVTGAVANVKAHDNSLEIGYEFR